LEQQARWLVSDDLQRQIAARSIAFEKLIAFERCHILQSNLLSDFVTEEEGPFFVAGDVPLKSRLGRYQRTWMMVIAPTEVTGRMPDANVLKLTDHKWTLFNREKGGSMRVVATGVY
jgi:predicted DCC family thiol-disulfide oxidoreductase YuxK